MEMMQRTVVKARETEVQSRVEQLGPLFNSDTPQEGCDNPSQADGATEVAATEADRARVEEWGQLFNKQELLRRQKEAGEAGFKEEQAGGHSRREGTGREVMIGVLEGMPSQAPVARAGRKATMTPEITEQLCLLLSVGLSRRQAASYLDIEHSTISKTAQRDEEFAYLVRRAEELSTVQPLMQLVAESRKNWRAAAWLIEHKKKYPSVMSEEEKAERQERRLADARRKVEFKTQLAIMNEEAREAEEKRRYEKNLAKRRAEIEEQYPKRKRKTSA
jgi:hypothetical protein